MDWVHFAMAALEEQASLVQSVLMAAEGIHVVAMVQAEREEESQHPWTPLKVLVAHVSLEFGQLTGDAVAVSSGLWY